MYTMGLSAIDEIMSELAKYSRMYDETAAIIEDLKDRLKKHMNDNGLETLNGSEHKATYKTVTSARVDTAAFKKECPELATRYTKTVTVKRFTFS